MLLTELPHAHAFLSCQQPARLLVEVILQLLDGIFLICAHQGSLGGSTAQQPRQGQPQMVTC